MEKSTKRNLRKAVIITYRIIGVLFFAAAMYLVFCLSSDSSNYAELSLLHKAVMLIGLLVSGSVGVYMINDSLKRRSKKNLNTSK